MTLQLGEQTITVDIMPNISQSEGNHPIKFGQLIESNKINNISILKYNNIAIFFARKYAEELDRETTSRPLFAFSGSFA